MSIRTTNIKIKVLADWKGIPAGTIARAKSVGFGCRITHGELLCEQPTANVASIESKKLLAWLDKNGL